MSHWYVKHCKTWGLCVCSLFPDLLSPHFATLCLCLCLCLCPPCVCSLFYPHTLPKSPQPQPTLCHFDLMWRLSLPPTYFRVPFKHLQATCKSMTSLFSLMRKLMRLFMFGNKSVLGREYAPCSYILKRKSWKSRLLQIYRIFRKILGLWRGIHPVCTV